MSRRRPRLAQLLKDVGARLIRHGHHLVYELPNGNRFVTAKTTSDANAEKAAIRQLMIAAGWRGVR